MKDAWSNPAMQLLELVEPSSEVGIKDASDGSQEPLSTNQDEGKGDEVVSTVLNDTVCG